MQYSCAASLSKYIDMNPHPATPKITGTRKGGMSYIPLRTRENVLNGTAPKKIV